MARYGQCPLSGKQHRLHPNFCPKDRPNWKYAQRVEELERVLRNYKSQSHKINAHEASRSERRTSARYRQYGPHYWVGHFPHQHGRYVSWLQWPLSSTNWYCSPVIVWQRNSIPDPPPRRPDPVHHQERQDHDYNARGPSHNHPQNTEPRLRQQNQHSRYHREEPMRYGRQNGAGHHSGAGSGNDCDDDCCCCCCCD